MRTRYECLKLQSIADEIKEEFPDAGAEKLFIEAAKRGLCVEDAEYVSVYGSIG